jgi:hypothetical protein
MKRRNIALYIVLSIITCGIFALYWFVVLTDDVNNASGHQEDDTSGVVSLLLTIVTCGIYGIYWAYKQGEKINEIRLIEGDPSNSSTPIIYLILEIIGLGIIAYALMQNELNEIISED